MIRRPFSHPRYDRAGRLAIAVSMGVWLACSPTPAENPPVYPVKGKVLYKGKPISGGVVVYERETDEAKGTPTDPGGGPLRATGRIEPDGSFHLMAVRGAEGVPEGRYKVAISSRPPRTEGGVLGGPADATKKGDPDVLRGRYADPKTSGLRDEVVKDRANEPTFDLK
jgi:hypothetical protein